MLDFIIALLDVASVMVTALLVGHGLVWCFKQYLVWKDGQGGNPKWLVYVCKALAVVIIMLAVANTLRLLFT